MTHATLRPGPLSWVAILFASCLLIVVFQKMLWLVVPFLFGLIGYYLLQPLQQRLVLAGLNSDRAAVLVGLLAGGLVLAILLPSIPWIGAHLVVWQETCERYIEGGLRLAADTLAWAEANSSIASRARLSDRLTSQISAFGDQMVTAYLAEAALAIATWLPSLLLAPVLTFFFLRDGWRFRRFVCAAVPNAFFERALYLIDRVDATARLYFHGLLKLTLLDAACLGGGLWMIGMSSPLLLGLMTAVLAWVPFVGSLAGCLLVVLVAATDFPGNPGMAYAAIGLFVWVRLLDDFCFMPMTIGRSLRLHPLLSVLMIFVGGALAGIPGMMLILPVLGVAMVIGETLAVLLGDPRLQARHAHACRLRKRRAQHDLQL